MGPTGNSQQEVLNQLMERKSGATLKQPPPVQTVEANEADPTPSNVRGRNWLESFFGGAGK